MAQPRRHSAGSGEALKHAVRTSRGRVRRRGWPPVGTGADPGRLTPSSAHALLVRSTTWPAREAGKTADRLGHRRRGVRRVGYSAAPPAVWWRALTAGDDTPWLSRRVRGRDRGSVGGAAVHRHPRIWLGCIGRRDRFEDADEAYTSGRREAERWVPHGHSPSGTSTTPRCWSRWAGWRRAEPEAQAGLRIAEQLTADSSACRGWAS